MTVHVQGKPAICSLTIIVHKEMLESCPVAPSYPVTSDVSSISRHSLTNLVMIGAGIVIQFKLYLTTKHDFYLNNIMFQVNLEKYIEQIILQIIHRLCQ